MRRERGKRPYKVCKRVFDITFSAAVIAVGLVPGALLAAVVAVDTKAAPIYVQKRVGRDGRPFRMLKFRTMVADADDVEQHLSPEQLEQWRRERKVDEDPRIASLGRILRATSIDEMPQFANVLLGQMSVVGPRAVTQDELEHYTEGDLELLLSVRPGITGLWQTGPRNIATFESGLRQKLELTYAANVSLALDAKLFFKTFRAVAEGTGK